MLIFVCEIVGPLCTFVDCCDLVELFVGPNLFRIWSVKICWLKIAAVGTLKMVLGCAVCIEMGPCNRMFGEQRV